MPVYRPVPQPTQGPKVAAILPAGGASISADSRLTTYSFVSGSSSAAKASDSRLDFRSTQAGQSSVARPATSSLFFRSLENGSSAVAKAANSALDFRSALSGAASVFALVLAEARLFFRSLLKGDSTVTTGSPTTIPIFDASRLTMAADIEDDRSADLRWLVQWLLDWYDSETFVITDPEMTKTGVRIESVVVGDDFRVSRVYTGLSSGIVLTTAWFTVKTSEAVPDGSALFQKMITTSPSASGHIVVSDTTNGYVEMYFDPTRADTLPAATTDYVYDIQVKTSLGKIYTFEKGTVTFISGVTDAA